MDKGGQCSWTQVQDKNSMQRTMRGSPQTEIQKPFIQMIRGCYSVSCDILIVSEAVVFMAIYIYGLVFVHMDVSLAKKTWQVETLP